MRRFWLAACVVAPLLPGLAMAQAAMSSAHAPADDSASSDMMGGPDAGGPGGWQRGHDHHDMFAGPEFLMKFYAANTTHDGHLTQAQAQAANLTEIVKNFSAIDVKQRGYVTFYDIVAWRLDTMAKRLEQQADSLRAKD